MQKRELSSHILPCSATMVGVCITSIGLVKIIETSIGPSRVDEYLALNSLLFLSSACFSYFSIRLRSERVTERLEKYADFCFISGLIIMVAIATLFAYECI